MTKKLSVKLKIIVIFIFIGTSDEEAVGGETALWSKCSWSPKNLCTMASKNRMSRNPVE
jgi:hypothetical protein